MPQALKQRPDAAKPHSAAKPASQTARELHFHAACPAHNCQRLARILRISRKGTPAAATHSCVTDETRYSSSNSEAEVLQSLQRRRRFTTSPIPPKRARRTLTSTTHEPPPSVTLASSTLEHKDLEDDDEDESWGPWKCCTTSTAQLLPPPPQIPAPKEHQVFLEDAISPCPAEAPPLHTLVYVKYPNNTPHCRTWKKFRWIDYVSVFEDLTRAVANRLLEDWGYRYTQDSIVFKYALNEELFPIENTFDATIASNSQEDNEDVYLHLISPGSAFDPNQ